MCAKAERGSHTALVYHGSLSLIIEHVALNIKSKFTGHEFNHFCIQVGSLDDIMRARNNALRWGVELRDDLLRHAPSGSIGVYLKDKARGFAVEFCVGHPQLDNDTHRARILPAAAETRDVWLAPLSNPLEPGSVTSPVTRADGSAAPDAAPSSSPELGHIVASAP